MNTMVLPVAILVLALFGPSGAAENRSAGEWAEEADKVNTIVSESLKVTVCYDNYSWSEGLDTGWGFSCLVTGGEKTILFDTGGDGATLIGNMEKLGIDIDDIDIIVLSHIHGDHVGGLKAILRINPRVRVFLPASFPAKIKEDAMESGAEVVEVSNPVSICEGIYSTGEMGTDIIEQSLVINTDQGGGVITGCAHPGIVKIVGKAVEITGAEPLFALGGFHLIRHGEAEIESIVYEFEKAGVRYAGPSHCSGDEAREIFRRKYGERFLEIGAGRVIDLGKL